MKNRIRTGLAIALAAIFVTTGFSQSRRPNERTASQLNEAQKRLQEDGRAQSAGNLLRSRMENEDTDELIRQAQERLKSLKQGNNTQTPAPSAAPAPASANPAPTQPAARTNPVAVARAAPVAQAPPQATPIRAAPVEAAPVAAMTSASATATTAPAAASAPEPSVAPEPDSVPMVAANPDVPPPRPLTPRYDRARKETPTMEITAKESLMDSPNHMVTFSGDVLVQHPGFTLKSEDLVIHLHEDESQPGAAPAGAEKDRPPFQRAIATGPMVEIERIGADGKIQIAKARRADYNAMTGDMELTGGPPTLQNGDSLINPEGADAKIFLTKDGKHRVTGGKVRMEIDLGTQGASQGPVGPSFGTGGLDSITTRNER